MLGFLKWFPEMEARTILWSAAKFKISKKGWLVRRTSTIKAVDTSEKQQISPPHFHCELVWISVTTLFAINSFPQTTPPTPHPPHSCLKFPVSFRT